MLTVGWPQTSEAPAKSYYRPDLYNELRRVALLGLGCNAVKLVPGTKVVSVVSIRCELPGQKLIRERTLIMQAPHLPTGRYSEVMY